MISHDLKCIYIHIPKTAGTSVESIFGEHKNSSVRLKQDHRSIMNLKNTIVPWQKSNYAILDWLKFLNQRYKALRDGVPSITNNQFNEYFKFAFVRNPWDRAYSWYRNVLRDEFHLQELNIKPDISFREFLVNHVEQWALRPQLDWLVDENGDVAVDFVGRFENLDHDFSVICSKIGIQTTPLPNILNSGASRYIEAYDTETQELIYQRYKAEIELFGYSFG